MTPGAPAPRPPVRSGIVALLDTWTDTPAWVQDRHLNVLVTNPAARGLGLWPGQNLLRALFLDPGAAGSSADGVRLLSALHSGNPPT
jgi:hypothetical protein